MKFFVKKNPYKNKKILVYGLGKSGTSSKSFLTACGAKVYTYVDGEKNKKINLEKLSLAIFSPGVSLNNNFAQKLIATNVPIISELELGYLNVDGNYIAITGTNGKTTTVSLIYKILGNENIFLAGNVGTPLVSFAGKTNCKSLIVCEVSSYQLETINLFHPKISAILNMSADHISRHKSLENYWKTKTKIFKNQTQNDFCVLNYDDKNVVEYSENCLAKKFYFSKFDQTDNKNFNGAYVCGNEIYFKENFYNVFIMNKSEIKLVGEKNLENVLAAITVSSLCGKSGAEILKKVSSFKPLEHRLEIVKKENNIIYINDSKATNVASSIADILALNTNVVALFGGSDKGENFENLFSALSEKIKLAVLFGATKHRLVDSAKKTNFKNFVEAKNLKQAFQIANNFCGKLNEETTLILAPACASFDEFRNFEERGEIFKKLVLEENNEKYSIKN